MSPEESSSAVTQKVDLQVVLNELKADLRKELGVANNSWKIEQGHICVNLRENTSVMRERIQKMFAAKGVMDVQFDNPDPTVPTVSSSSPRWNESLDW